MFALRSVNPDAAVMPAMPMPMPTSAVSSGSPAASSEPNVITRTIAATATPRISVAPVSGAARMASPPISTVRPVPLGGLPQRRAVGVGQLERLLVVADLDQRDACRPGRPPAGLERVGDPLDLRRVTQRGDDLRRCLLVGRDP